MIVGVRVLVIVCGGVKVFVAVIVIVSVAVSVDPGVEVLVGAMVLEGVLILIGGVVGVWVAAVSTMEQPAIRMIPVAIIK